MSKITRGMHHKRTGLDVRVCPVCGLVLDPGVRCACNDRRGNTKPTCPHFRGRVHAGTLHYLLCAMADGEVHKLPFKDALERDMVYRMICCGRSGCPLRKMSKEDGMHDADGK